MMAQDAADKDIEAAVAPFDRLQHRQIVISRYLICFREGRLFCQTVGDKEEGKQGVCSDPPALWKPRMWKTI